MSLFDEREWVPLPDGVALHRRDLSPCPCGERRFDVLRRRREDGSVQIRVVCPNPKCIKRLSGEVAVGRVDMFAGQYQELGRSAG